MTKRPYDPDGGKKAVAALLICVALGLAVFAYVMWEPANRHADDKNRANTYATALGGYSYDEVKPNHTGSLAAAGGAAVLFLGGLVLVAGSRPAPRAPA